jgi:hypothetical protein
MAHVSRWLVFFRAFMITLLVGVPTSGGRAQATDGEDWSRSVQEGSAEGYYRYLRRNPTGQHIQEAIDALRRLGALGGSSVRSLGGGNRSGTVQRSTGQGTAPGGGSSVAGGGSPDGGNQGGGQGGNQGGGSPGGGNQGGGQGGGNQGGGGQGGNQGGGGVY